MTITTSQSDAWAQMSRVLTLADYNTRVVVLGVVMLGIASGVIGTFMLLRKRALLGDAVSHATLPGIAIAFLVMVLAGGTGKWLPGLLLGALVSGLIGMGGVLLIRGGTRLKEDAALGIVLSVTFGLGIALLGVIQQLEQGHAAGLESFIYGKTASMLARDAWMIAGTGAIVIMVCTLFFKEFGLLCFDQHYAASRGMRTTLLDVLMMSLVVLVTVIGLQAVGLILMIALLIIPPAAARFWTHRLGRTVIAAAVIGGVSCLIGAGWSAMMANLPAGAVIVIVAGSVFLLSMIFGSARGVLRRGLEHVQLSRTIHSQNLLRALFEWNEAATTEPARLSPDNLREPMAFDRLLTERSWGRKLLQRTAQRALRKHWIRQDPDQAIQLTSDGFFEARRIVRNHRLWETYLITYADIAPNHVDRSADTIEHILGRDMVARLEEILAREAARAGIPNSPHKLTSGQATA